MKKNKVHGTPEQFEIAVENRIRELGGTEDISSSCVTASNQFKTKVVEEEGEGAEKWQAIQYVDNSGNLLAEIEIWPEGTVYVDEAADSINLSQEYDSIQDFESDLKNKVKGISSASNIKSASETDPEFQERYIHTLIGDIDSELSDKVESITFDTDQLDDSLVVTVVDTGVVKEYIVPYIDLKFDWDNIETDVSYVVDEILNDISL